MNFITVRDLRSRPKDVWKMLETEKDVIVTNNGKPSAIMLPIGEDDFEEVLAAIRQARAMRAVSRMQIATEKAGLSDMTLEDINEEIAASRRERKEKHS